MRLEALAGQSLYLDSNALIFAVETEASRQPPAVRAFLEAISAGRITAIICPIVRAEVLVLPLKNGDSRLAEAYRTMLSGRGPIRSVVIDDAVADRTAELRARHPALKLADALHLAAALTAGCQAFLSGDQRLRAAAAAHIVAVSWDDITV